LASRLVGAVAEAVLRRVFRLGAWNTRDERGTSTVERATASK
jgi:hypothetical protein